MINPGYANVLRCIYCEIATTYVGRQNGVVRTSASVEYGLVGSAAEVSRIVIGSTRGAASSDVMQVDLVTWTVDVFGAVDVAAVPRRVLTRAGQAHHATSSAVAEKPLDALY